MLSFGKGRLLAGCELSVGELVALERSGAEASRQAVRLEAVLAE